MLKDCILIVPASGFSNRFGHDDKLLADFQGRPLASHMASAMAGLSFAQKIAVVPDAVSARAAIFTAHGFDIAVNPQPERGQDGSIAAGLLFALGQKHSAAQNEALSICVMLADMPLVPAAHVEALFKMGARYDTVKTQYEGHLQPPALFTRRAAQAWGCFAAGEAECRPKPQLKEGRVPLSFPYGEDVDTTDELLRLEAIASDLP